MTTDLPDWVYQLVHEIRRSEDGHPIRYRAYGDGNGGLVYKEVECPERKFLALIPDEIQTAVEIAVRWTPAPRCQSHGEIAATCERCATDATTDRKGAE